MCTATEHGDIDSVCTLMETEEFQCVLLHDPIEY